MKYQINLRYSYHILIKHIWGEFFQQVCVNVYKNIYEFKSKFKLISTIFFERDYLSLYNHHYFRNTKLCIEKYINRRINFEF